MSPDDRWRLLHIVEAIEQAQAFVEGRQRADLGRDVMLRLALVQLIQIVGEAAARLSEAGRAELPGVPWVQITGMRNRLVHAYFDVDHNIVWDTVQLALPPLLGEIKQHLEGT